MLNGHLFPTNGPLKLSSKLDKLVVTDNISMRGSKLVAAVIYDSFMVLIIKLYEISSILMGRALDYLLKGTII